MYPNPSPSFPSYFKQTQYHSNDEYDISFCYSGLSRYPTSESGICFVHLWNASSSVFLLVRQRVFVHNHPIIAHISFKLHFIKKINMIFLFARLTLYVYPSSEFEVCFWALWNGNISVFLLIHQKMLVHNSLIIRFY